MPTISNVYQMAPSGYAYVTYDNLTIPPDSVLFFASGQDTSSSAAVTMTDSTASFTPDEYNTGFTLRNTSDGSTGIITDGTTNAILCAGGMSGGNNNNWDAGDYYEIVVTMDADDQIVYETTTDVGGTVSLSVKGVPTITGASGTHVFSWYLIDATDSVKSATYTCTVTV